MRQVHCDGCGFAEPVRLPKPQIKSVSLDIVNEPRFSTGTKTVEADLCPTCIGQMLHMYFDIPAKGALEIPAFIEPGRHSMKVV